MATIYYWHGQDKRFKIPYMHGQEIANEEVFKIAQKIFESGLNVMVRKTELKELILFVDDGRFTQR